MMRKTQLLTATALSLILGAAVAMAGQAVAATTISTATTTPVKTSTTGDLTVDTAGSITLTSGTAVTVDSDNTVTLNGPITMSSSDDGSTGILIADISGRTHSDVVVSANITVTDNFTATDTTSPADGILEAPYSDGKTRYGIHSVGTTAFDGNVTVVSGSTIAVDGDNSYGIRFENNLNGALTFGGVATITGDNSVGIALDKGATGNVYLAGSQTVLGQGSSAVRLDGDYGGNIILSGSYSGTGYASTTSPSGTALVTYLGTPADIQQSGPLVSISGNVAHGILVDAVPVTDTTNTSVDQDGDGIIDSAQGTAALTSYGAAPALQIGSSANDITIGPEVYASTAVSPPAIAYGLDIRGAVTGSGIYQNVNPVGLQLGGMGHEVTIANGIRVKGTVQAVAYGGLATAMSVGSGTWTPQLDISGTINATGNSAITSTTSGTTTTYSTVDAGTRALDIAANAHLPTINIAASTGGIYAVSGGKNATATAIRDQSDSLTTINNNNVISATISADDENGDGVADTVANRSVAIDTHTNDVGLTLTQTDTAPTDSDADTAIPAPYILGDILLGSGDDSITSSGGTITGNIDFGNGANTFVLKDGAVYNGRLTGTGTVNFDLAGGTAGLLSGTSLNLTNLHVGATSSLALSLDTEHPTVAPLNASGAATFDDGGNLLLTLDNIVTDATSFAVLKAGGGIDLGNMATSDISGRVPFIYHTDLALNAAHTELDANFRLKTQAEAGYSDNEYAALVPVLTAAAKDPGGEAALITPIDKAGFDKVYEQYLPDYSGEDLINLSLGAESLNRSLGDLTLVPDNDGGQYWLQEYGYHTKRNYGSTAGFSSTGFSFAGGRETKMDDHNMLGVYMSYTSGSPLDTFAIAKEDNVNSDMTIGGYWRVRDGAFKAWAHAGAGYTYFKTVRQVLSASVNHVAYAKWNGLSYSAGAGASVNYNLGRLGVTPQVFADLYGLDEKAHNETSPGDTIAEDSFDLSVGKRDGHLLSSSALINFSYNKLFVKPELWVGYKQNITGSIPDTVAMFKDGTPFTLNGGGLKGGGPVAGFRLSADNQWSYFALEGDYEKQDTYTNYSLSLRTRFQF